MIDTRSTMTDPTADAIPQPPRPYDDLFDDPWFENSVPVTMATVELVPPSRWPAGEVPYVRPHCPRVAMEPLPKP